MEERWWLFVWMAGAVVGYVLFMRQHPLRAAFGIGFQFARNNLTIVAGLATLLVATVAWRYFQSTGLGSDNTVAFSMSAWEDLLGWVPYANEDLRAVFWFCVPLDVAFILGTPTAFLACWYWMPRLWKACPQGKKWLAVLIFSIYALTLWWWSHRLCEVFQLGFKPAPEVAGLHHLLRGIGERGFAVLVVCFIQSVILLGAYRSHGSGTSRCLLKDALDWGLKSFPRMAPIQLVVLLAVGINWLVEERLDLKAAPLWDGLKFISLIVTAAVPICVLLLQDLNPWEAVRASFRFLLRTGWRYAWFLFLCLTHFFLLRLLESYLLASVLTHQTSVLVWYVVAAILKAGLVIWFVNALCLYFCIDVTQRKQKKPMKLATLQARTSARKRLFSRLS
ncbi:MAG: hypothetical protein ACI8T1_003262 [Verrucomicrobiales bacterium]|jgi:hypothetical protein